jgi:hypothetical protein
VAGDFNGDGHLDLAVANEADNTVTVLLGKGNGTFQPLRPVAVGHGPDALVAGDFNGDGRLDLAEANQTGDTVQVLLGYGDGSFRIPPVTPVVNPDGTYPLPAIIPVGTNANSLAAGRFTLDGHLDLAVVAGGTVQVLLGTSADAFRPPVPVNVGVLPGALVLGDFNGDGIADLAVASFLGTADSVNGTIAVTVLAGRGDGGFVQQPTTAVSVGPSPDALTAGDFTGTGVSDLILGTRNGDLLILLGRGNATFAPARPIDLLISPPASTSTPSTLFAQAPTTQTPALTSQPAVATAAEANAAFFIGAASESAAVTESPAARSGGVPDPVGGQADDVSGGSPDAVNFSAIGDPQAGTDVASSLLTGVRPRAALLPQRKGSSGLPIGGLADSGADEAAAEAVIETDDKAVHLMVGLNYTPQAGRPVRPGGAAGRPIPPVPGKSQQSVSARGLKPKARQLPAERNGHRDFSLLDRLWAEPQVALALGAAGIAAAGVYRRAARSRSAAKRTRPGSPGMKAVVEGHQFQ